MKTTTTLMALSALLAATLAAQAVEKPMKLFILSGQSNCVGKGCGDKLPAEYRETPDNLLLYQNSWGLKGWQKLAPYPAHPGQAKMYGCGDTMFGPEISFGHAIQKQFPNDRIGIVKVCVGGTSVASWSKDFGSPANRAVMEAVGYKDIASQKSLYAMLLADVRAALASVAGQFEVAGFVWIQAERDSQHPAAARVWPQRVLQLHRDLAADIGYPASVPLVVMGPHYQVYEKGQTEHAAPMLAAIRQAAAAGGPVTMDRLRQAAGLGAVGDAEMKKALGKLHVYGEDGLRQFECVGIMHRGLDELAKQHPNLRIVQSDDLPTHEGLHFDTAGVIELGRRLAQACLK
jgi:hypothetical protein